MIKIPPAIDGLIRGLINFERLTKFSDKIAFPLTNLSQGCGRKSTFFKSCFWALKRHKLTLCGPIWLTEIWSNSDKIAFSWEICLMSLVENLFFQNRVFGLWGCINWLYGVLFGSPKFGQNQAKVPFFLENRHLTLRGVTGSKIDFCQNGFLAFEIVKYGRIDPYLANQSLAQIRQKCLFPWKIAIWPWGGSWGQKSIFAKSGFRLLKLSNMAESTPFD